MSTGATCATFLLDVETNAKKNCTCRILLELKPKEDPVWVYLDSCHYQIMDKLKIAYANQMKHVEGGFNA